MNKQFKKIERKVETLLRSHSAIYSVGSWSGREVKVTLQNLDAAYIKFSMLSPASFQLSVCFGELPDINGTIHSI